MRLLISYILPILLPSLAWIVWSVQRQRIAQRTGVSPPPAPWGMLYIIGGVLALLTLLGLYLSSDYSIGTYRPAYVDENGTIIPGRFEEGPQGGPAPE